MKMQDKTTSIRCRVGRFVLSNYCLYADPNELLLLFSNTVVLEAHAIPSLDETEYRALSPLFRELKEGELVPAYEFIFHRADDRHVSLKECVERPEVPQYRMTAPVSRMPMPESRLEQVPGVSRNKPVDVGWDPE
jgi:hypothetical protein